MSKEINPEQLGKACLLIGSLTLATTYLASRGAHSRIHHQIARVALGAEALTIFAGIGLLKLSDDKKWASALKAGGILGLGVTALCHTGVALTDTHLDEFRETHKSLANPDDLAFLGSAWLSDTKRHLRNGTKAILRCELNYLKPVGGTTANMPVVYSIALAIEAIST